MRKIYLALLLGVLATACVPQRKFEDMKKNYNETLKKKNECDSSYAALKAKNEAAGKTIEEQRSKVENLQKDTTLMGSGNRRLNSLYNQINGANEKLLEKLNELESKNKMQKQELSAELLEAQRKLNEREVEIGNKEVSLKKQDEVLETLKHKLDELQGNLQKTQGDLQAREKRVKELSSVLSQKDSVVKALKTTVSNALLSFKDKGLSVSVKNGKVYVSVEDKLLFKSGKYTVNSDGRDALLQLASALNSQKDVNIMVEGHTDNVPYKSTGVIKDNLDLSVMRATEVARILSTDGKVDPARIVAAGRGDTQPVAGNDTVEGKAKNRRTEIILTPKLSELFKILDQN